MARTRRAVSYRWRLRELMASAGMFSTTELVPLLAERGIDLSASQVHRLVTGTPERLSMMVLAALCDIFDTTPADLIHTAAENASPRTATAADAPDTTTSRPASRPGPSPAIRPTRARIRPEQ
jgi:DNA-binding Xre family transcriptional regulator